MRQAQEHLHHPNSSFVSPFSKNSNEFGFLNEDEQDEFFFQKRINNQHPEFSETVSFLKGNSKSIQTNTDNPLKILIIPDSIRAHPSLRIHGCRFLNEEVLEKCVKNFAISSSSKKPKIKLLLSRIVFKNWKKVSISSFGVLFLENKFIRILQIQNIDQKIEKIEKIEVSSKKKKKIL